MIFQALRGIERMHAIRLFWGLSAPITMWCRSKSQALKALGRTLSHRALSLYIVVAKHSASEVSGGFKESSQEKQILMFKNVMDIYFSGYRY